MLLEPKVEPVVLAECKGLAELPPEAAEYQVVASDRTPEVLPEVMGRGGSSPPD
jgi:hypothetical protein